MDGGAIELVVRAARIEAVVLTAFGLFLVFLDMNAPSEPSGLRRRLSALLRAMAQLPMADIPSFAVSHSLRAVDRFVVYWYEQSERNVVTSGLFTLIVFVAIPLAALLNWFRGGSPFLMFVLAGCVTATAVLAVLGETRAAPRFARGLSAGLFAAIFVFVPAYVFVSLTDRTLNMPIGHGMLVSILLAPMLYLVSHSAVLCGAATGAAPVASNLATPLRRIATLFAAAAPFAYLCVFAALLIWHLVYPELPVPSTWPVLLTGMLGGALAAAICAYLVTPARRGRVAPAWLAGRLVMSLVFAVALAAAAIGLPGEMYWISAAPALLAPVLLIVLIAVALCVRLILTISAVFPGGSAFAERPYRVAGILFLLSAAASGWASVTL